MKKIELTFEEANALAVLLIQSCRDEKEMAVALLNSDEIELAKEAARKSELFDLLTDKFV